VARKHSPDDLPSGTVTFVFTDIEGSTRLLRHLGEAYTRVQDDHAAIMRKAIDDEDGTVIRTEGDSFFAVFRSAVQAARAVLAAQRGLAAHEWTHGAPLLVRMGMHTGEGVPGGDDYIGIDVNRAARIAAAAHGGQVLLSEATRALVEETLPDDVGVLDLGEHRLKDFDRPIRLFQLTAPGLRKDFPPPSTLEVPTNLPTERTAFIGRDHELAGLVEMVRRRRLVTLTGPGGTGKTRLALRAAGKLLDDSPNGVFFVDLAPISDPGLVPSTIAAALGVREEGARPALDVLVDHLRPQKVLLVLDNFEQILEAATVVATLLDAAPDAKAIVTSRTPLRLSGEQEYPVPPLAIPDLGGPEPDLLSGYESVALFVERAKAVDPGFALTNDNASAVAEICRRVDGLPLAIELAASRVRMLTPGAILQRFDRRLPLLTTSARDVPDRHRTITATIDWSHDLLGEPEQALFRRLAAFVGGWTFESAEEIANPGGELEIETLDGLESLGEKSLVQRAVSDHELRFRMLETIREYGLEQLRAAGEFEATHTRHQIAFLELAERAESQLYGRDSRAWLDRLESEHDNLRLAIRWAIDSGRAEDAMRLASALWRFWQIRGHLTEGRRWVEAVFAMPAAGMRSAVRAKALLAAGSLAYWQGDLETTARQYEESLSISRELNDARGIADGLFNLSFVQAALGRSDVASRYLLEARATFEQLGDARQAAFAAVGLGVAAARRADWETASKFATEALARFESLGDAFGIGLSSGVLGHLALAVGDNEAGRRLFLTSLSANEEIGDRLGLAVALEATALIAGRRGRHDVSLRLAGAADSIKKTDRGQAPVPWYYFEDLRDLASGTHSPEQVAAALELGSDMSVEEAIALAREELQTEDGS
jgi:predicted ATPase/class 3 adenylate cyclase